MATDEDAISHLRLACRIAGMEVGEFVLPRDELFETDGLTLHYLDWGGGPGRRPLLFLHGGRLTAHTWDLVCVTLRSDFHCLALDQRGHGDSDWSPDHRYGSELGANDIGAWIEQLGIDQPVLIGHSLGGLHAMTYAARPDTRVAGLVMVDVGPGVVSAGADRILDFALRDPGPGSLEDFVERAVAFNPRRDRRLLRRSLLHNLRQLPDGRWAWKHDPGRATREQFEEIKASVERLWDHADAISCPVLVVRGEESEVYGDEEARAFARALPDGRWTTVESAGHNIQGDNPAGLVDALRVFLTEIS